MDSSSTVDIKYWDEMKDILNSMLGGTGTVVLSPALGTVTITTTPDLMRSVASYIAQENERMSRQIAINVEIYNITIGKNEDFDVTFTAFLKKFAGIAAELPTSANPPSSVGSLTGLASATIAILNPRAGHSGVTDVFQALSELGNTTRVAQFPMVTLNNRPVTVRIGEDVAYAASSSVALSTTTTTTTPVTSITPGTISEGFTMTMSPRLLDDGRILMHYALSDVDLPVPPSESQFTSGGPADSAGSSTIELPTTVDRSFSQQFVVRSGSTLIIGGLNQREADQSAQGVGNPYNFLFGGGTSNSVTDTMMLIAITPQVIDVPQAEHG
jgi:type IVB pilus formation R64 PilN family outer membrane protein